MIELLASALVLASMYGLVAVGISLTWSSVGMLNLAQGFVFTAGGYVAYLFAQYMAKNFSIRDGLILSLGVVVLGMLGSAVAGLLVGGLAFLPLHDRINFPVRGLIATLAISIIGTQIFMVIFGPQSKPLPQIFGIKRLKFGEFSIAYGQIGTIVVATIVLLLVTLWMRNSRRGLQMRAMMMNPLGANMVGVSVRTTGMIALALSGALSGLASVLLGQIFFVSPTSGVQPLIVGLIISLAGGLGSMPGTVAAAVLLG
ncbi:MAG: branched-chain amino acid ABC transporter permease, partial [Actinobacteria bacterium]|nr:branched-chain amino acid ABC transporter permease [Actinomycetota bacterium]